ncbi:uncharacterized protein [Panulirus ornatus]
MGLNFGAVDITMLQSHDNTDVGQDEQASTSSRENEQQMDSSTSNMNEPDISESRNNAANFDESSRNTFIVDVNDGYTTTSMENSFWHVGDTNDSLDQEICNIFSFSEFELQPENFDVALPQFENGESDTVSEFLLRQIGSDDSQYWDREDQDVPAGVSQLENLEVVFECQPRHEGLGLSNLSESSNQDMSGENNDVDDDHGSSDNQDVHDLSEFESLPENLDNSNINPFYHGHEGYVMENFSGSSYLNMQWENSDDGDYHGSSDNQGVHDLSEFQPHPENLDNSIINIFYHGHEGYVMENFNGSNYLSMQ